MASNTCHIPTLSHACPFCTRTRTTRPLPCPLSRWAIGMNHLRATSSSWEDDEPLIYKKGPAFGMPGVHVDGMDVLKVGVFWAGGWACT